MNYIDKFGFYNVKPVSSNREPTSNDGWIHTAYADKLGVPVDRKLLKKTYDIIPKEMGVPLLRRPEKIEPPLSRDVVLGMAYFGFAGPIILNGWNFSPVKLPPFDLIKTIKQFISCIGKDRKYFWQNSLTQIYRFAFMVPFQDRAFILRCFGVKVPWYYQLIQYVDMFKEPKKPYLKLIRWLKYNAEVEYFEVMAEFGDIHPITTEWKERES